MKKAMIVLVLCAAALWPVMAQAGGRDADKGERGTKRMTAPFHHGDRPE